METQFFNTDVLKKTGEWQRAILDSANFTIISTDLTGTILTLNAGALKRLGYTKDELIGTQNMIILHHPKEIEARAATLSRELGRSIKPDFEVFAAKAREGAPDEQEWTYIRKDGSSYPVQLSMTPVCSRAGELTGFLGIASDITERKKAEAAQQQLIRELQAALERVKMLRGLLPICASCKSVRNDQGYWQRIENYLKEHSEAEFSHAICPECLTKLYPDFCEQVEATTQSPDGPGPGN
jgi:PAS domain S-box-containing protein